MTVSHMETGDLIDVLYERFTCLLGRQGTIHSFRIDHYPLPTPYDTTLNTTGPTKP